MLKRAMALSVVAVLLVSLLLWSRARTEAPHVSGFIEADEIRIGSRVGGRVSKVRVAEGQAVKAGEVLVELEPFDFAERRRRAEAVVAERQAALRQVEAGFRPEEVAQAKARRDQLAARFELVKNGPRPEEIAQARAHRDQLAARLQMAQTGPREEEIAAARSQVELAEAELEAAESTFRRTQALVEKSAVSREEMDRATESVKVARAAREVRKEELAKLLQGTRKEEIEEAKAKVEEANQALAALESGSRPEEIEEARAQLEEAEEAWKLRQSGYRAEEVEAAKAALAAAEADLAILDRQIEELAIRAPAEGLIEAIELQPGDLAVANAPVLTVVGLSRLWVRAYVPEDRIDLANGTELRVSVDAFPGERFKGRVSFVARQAEFTPGNVQTPEDRSEQVYRIRVELEEGAGRLRAGMVADVWLPDREGGR
ncbi:MAG: efflux RND transporter periplasmic adaptor subunit [Planctomycetes bacterium]|nr:efflux RND transporter periplasmic adaptor subunit [Planctomycetota bacterium]